jgi:hypothetical protein
LENARLKKIDASLSLDKDAMQTLFQEKRMEFVGQRHVSKLL